MLRRCSNISKKRNFIKLFAFFSICILFFQFPIEPNRCTNLYNQEEENPFLVKTSYFNNSCGPINISGNAGWEALAANPWCTKVGGVYFLENLTINGGGSANCIEISNSTVSFVIRNCTLFNAGAGYPDPKAGIRLNNVSNGQLIENNCSNNFLGIFLKVSTTGSCQDISIVRNYLSNNQFGLCFTTNATNNFVAENTILNNSLSGIFLSNNCSGNMFRNNEIAEGSFGIVISVYSPDNTVYDNEIYDMSIAGISIVSNCNNNVISTNEIYNNQYGIGIETNCSYNTINYTNIFNNEYGIVISNYSGECNYNLFYQNRFNNPEGVNALDNCSNNQWDNGVIGNYWHDYNGTDALGDGIGDTPYNISGTGGGVDRFPIVESPPPGDDLLTTIIFVVAIASVSTVAGISFYFKHSRKSRKKKRVPFKSQRAKTISPEALMELLDEKNGLTLVSNLGDINYTSVSQDFYQKVDSLKLNPEERALFSREILSYSPKKRQEILDEMLAFSKARNNDDFTTSNTRDGDDA
ncbi:MAG: nitrous oxide reductase family maturation protein NosD [Promethearchaeota archaeon]